MIKMKALLIEFNSRTGIRAGNISPRDKNLFCFGHQNLSINPAIEIRVIMDNRSTDIYEGIKGVTVLHSNVEIDKAIDNNMIPMYKIDEFITGTDMKERNIKFSDLKGESRKEIAKELKELGIKGITSRKYLKTKDMK